MRPSSLGALLYLLGSVSLFYSEHGSSLTSAAYAVACTIGILVLLRLIS